MIIYFLLAMPPKIRGNAGGGDRRSIGALRVLPSRCGKKREPANKNGISGNQTDGT